MSHPPPALAIRAAHFPDDAAPAAELLSASNSDWPVTAELLQHEHDHRDPDLFFTERLAVSDYRVALALGRSAG